MKISSRIDSFYEDGTFRSALKVHQVNSTTVGVAGLEEYEGPWERRQMLHLLRRTMFGNKRSDLDQIKNLSLSEAVDRLFKKQSSPPPPVNEYQGLIKDPNVPEGETWIHADWDMELSGFRVQSVNNWWVNLIHYQDTSIQMKMAFFWTTLFTTSHFDAGTGKLPYYYTRLIFDHALGNYREFLKAYSVEPLTLKYLNGDVNTKWSPDENFAREVQELFAIGKGPDSGYTEDDVVAAARVLTGWTYSWPEHDTHFKPERHDTEDKQFSSFYGNKVIKGRPGNLGSAEADEFLDMLVDHPECAKHIARRLYTFFISPLISEEIEATIIAPFAQVLRDNDFEIIPSMKVLLKSAHFFDEDKRGGIVKSPLDFIQGTLRTFDVEIPTDVAPHEKYQIERSMCWLMSEQGLLFAEPPSVAGWPAYYQVPTYDKNWATTNTVALRGLRTDSMLYWGYWTPVRLLNIDTIKFVEEFDDPADPNALINETLEFLLGYDQIDDSVKTRLKSILLSGNLVDSYWTGAWEDYRANPTDAGLRGVVETRLKRLLQVVLQMAEFQLH